MKGAKFTLENGHVVEVISDIYIVTEEHIGQRAYVIVKYLENNAVGRTEVSGLNRVTTDAELEKWNKS